MDFWEFLRDFSERIFLVPTPPVGHLAVVSTSTFSVCVCVCVCECVCKNAFCSCTCICSAPFSLFSMFLRSASCQASRLISPFTLPETVSQSLSLVPRHSQFFNVAHMQHWKIGSVWGRGYQSLTCSSCYQHRYEWKGTFILHWRKFDWIFC